MISIQVSFGFFRILITNTLKNKSSHQRCSITRSVLRNFAKCTRENQKCSVKKVWVATLLKKRLTLVFSYEFCEISKNIFFTEHLWTTAFVRNIWKYMIRIPNNIYLFKANNRNTVKRCEICLQLTTKHQNDINKCFYYWLWKARIYYD